MKEILKESVSGASDLIISSGSTRMISARRWQVRNLIIENGGTLVGQPNSATWLMFEASEKIIIEGTLLYKNFLNDQRSFAATTSSGRQLNHKFILTRLRTH